MDNQLPRRAHAPLVAIVSIQALMAALIGTFSVTCTGWAVDGNNKVLLGVRLAGYLACSGGAVYAVVKHRYLVSSCVLVATSLFYIWFETGWLFRQPAFNQPSKFAMLPLVIALMVLLAPHSPTLNQPGREGPVT